MAVLGLIQLRKSSCHLATNVSLMVHVVEIEANSYCLLDGLLCVWLAIQVRNQRYVHLDDGQQSLLEKDITGKGTLFGEKKKKKRKGIFT